MWIAPKFKAQSNQHEKKELGNISTHFEFIQFQYSANWAAAHGVSNWCLSIGITIFGQHTFHMNCIIFFFSPSIPLSVWCFKSLIISVSVMKTTKKIFFLNLFIYMSNFNRSGVRCTFETRNLMEATTLIRSVRGSINCIKWLIEHRDTIYWWNQRNIFAQPVMRCEIFAVSFVLFTMSDLSWFRWKRKKEMH